MPDILDKEKSQIRELAKEYAVSMWKIPFNEGLVLYVKTNNELHKHPARWKYCLKCGEINKKEKMDNHRCLKEIEDFPVLIQTSWIQLKKFFLSNRFRKLMKEAGIDEIPTPIILTETKADITDLAEDLPRPVSEKEGN
ncbi:MAG: hypothetical protein H7641_14280 [Candidatus Heimdallarchaeota archaeon]|nr:hypothetical protein [Candidatus Heimdallarchaeota archaeon]MCK4878729.1 hypothetical protein [Candidatus Heimdallarchaeota archaeon]